MYAKCRTYIDKWYSVGKGAYSAYTNLTPPPPLPLHIAPPPQFCENYNYERTVRSRRVKAFSGRSVIGSKMDGGPARKFLFFL